MININLCGRILYKHEKEDWYAISEDGNLLIMILKTDYCNEGKFQMYIKKGGNHYEEIEHNIPSQCYCQIYDEKKDTTYIIRVQGEFKAKNTQNTMFRIDINTRLITQIYYTDVARRLGFNSPFIYELTCNQDLKLTSIDQTTKIKDKLFQCVSNFTTVKYKGEYLLVIQYLNNEEQYYREPEFERVFEYNGKRLSEIKNTLFIRSPNSTATNDDQCKVHYVMNSYNDCYYEFWDQNKKRIDQPTSHAVGMSKLFQMRPKSKIFRKFKRGEESNIISKLQLIINTTRIEEEYQHFIVDIRNGQEQQILSHYEITVTEGRLLELRDQEVWIYELEQNDQKLQLQ